MATYWDKQQISITNQTGMTLTINDVGALAHGEWDSYPSASIPNGAVAAPAFCTRSVSASEVGPGPGEVKYGLPDGTILDITFNMPFAVGQHTWVQATAGGPRGANYTVAIDCNENWWHGQGRRYYGTVTVTASTQGPNTGICRQTN